MEREEQSERIAESESERKTSSEDRDVVSPLASEADVTSPHPLAETPSQKVPPPKPKRPLRGWESPLLNRSVSGDEQAGTSQIDPPENSSRPSGDNSQEKPAPPVRRDSIHRTREQMEKLQHDPVESEETKIRSKSGGKPPPPPPKRDDSLTASPPPHTVFETALDATDKSESRSKRGPPPKPVRVDSVKNPTAEVSETVTPAQPLLHPPDLLSDVLSDFTATAKPPPTAPKPAVKPKPPPVAKKPVTAKPAVPKPVASSPGAALPMFPTPPSSVLHKPVPPVAAKRTSPESPKVAPPVAQKAAVKPKPSPVEVLPSPPDDLVENHTQADLSLEDAIKTVLRSPTTQKRHMSPARDSPIFARRELESHDLPPYEPDNSDKLMDDIDNMLKDLNKELDELIPGM